MSRGSSVLTDNNKENDENSCLSCLGRYFGCFICFLLLGALVHVGNFIWNDVITPGWNDVVTPGFISVFRECTYRLDQVVKIEISETEKRGNLTYLTKTPWKCDEEVRIELQEAIHIPIEIQSGTIKIKITTVKGPYVYIGNVIGIEMKQKTQLIQGYFTPDGEFIETKPISPEEVANIRKFIQKNTRADAVEVWNALLDTEEWSAWQLKDLPSDKLKERIEHRSQFIQNELSAAQRKSDEIHQSIKEYIYNFKLTKIIALGSDMETFVKDTLENTPKNMLETYKWNDEYLRELWKKVNDQKLENLLQLRNQKLENLLQRRRTRK